jgi:hypothetical protein
MPTMLKTFAAASAIVGLCGCVGAAGVSTWEYQSGPGYETARAQGSRIQVDASEGLTHEACTSVSRRQIAESGEVTEADLSACRSN